VSAQPVYIVVNSHSPDETEALGRRIGARLRQGDVVVLLGPLGAGKTVLARGIAEGAGARGYVASPSFVVVREYDGPVRIYHADLYRLERSADIVDLGLAEFADRGVLLVEWAEREPDLVANASLRIDCGFGARETDRVVTLRAPAALAGRLEGVGRV
jgi:tRNA threonylcarbamoyladenosine biosynthesis protein TsaE